MKTLSFITSTYNEEKNLPACLDSIKDIADEIIVVDGSSEDKTVAIAKEYVAKIKVTDNPAIFLINRQKAIDMATKDWLLNLDADERLTPELQKEIVAILKNDDSEINGYWIPRKNWFLGRYLMKGGVYPDYQLRLYRKGKVHFNLKDVHEQAIVEGKTAHLKSPMIHLSDPQFSRYLKRFNRYTDRIADELQEKNVSLASAPNYLVIKPLSAFIWTYGRHKGFADNWQGVVFHFFSALRFPVGYMKSLKKNRK